MALTNSISDVSTIIRGLIHDQSRIDGRDSWIYKTDNIFTLSESFIDSNSIKVFKNGVEISTDDWGYSTDNNQVIISFITSGESLVKNDTIVITYSYYKKYSDTEIQGYIESSLSYFAQYNYKKIFEINSSDQIVSTNDINPTKKELYAVALVASILIDPQNTRISIPDLTISARREKSDQDQIKDVFTNLKKYVGNIYFEQLDNDPTN